ncbi:MAG: sporulation protein YqfD [Ruminococcaceae bacterium]|nr:sporulation protein YqfD [Oscillospiraceae bacterium]
MPMYKRVANYLRGSVLCRVESPCPERVLNLCAVRKIPFWDLRWESELSFTMRLAAGVLPDLWQAAEQTGAQVELLEKQGAPFFLRQFRRRYALLLGFALFWLLLFGGNFFIWGFEVTGNDVVSTQTILRELEAYGITVGTSGFSIDQEDMRNHVLLKLPDVSWLAVNVRGCVAHVQVVERQRPPQTIRDEEICNVVAARAGLITKIQALDGEAKVSVGSTVTEGQLLISGVVDSPQSGVRLLHGLGEVWARTWHELSVAVPLTEQQRTGEGEVNRYYAVDIGKQRIKFYGKGSVTGGNCDKIIRYKPISLPGGFRLPLTVVVEEVTHWETTTWERTPEDAQREGEELLLRQLEEKLTDGGSITDTQFTAKQQGDFLLVTLQAECLEQIGETVTIAEMPGG